MGRTARIRRKKKVCLLVRSSAVKLNDDSSLITLVKWLKSHGWKPTCTLHPTLFSTTGRGLMAGSNITNGEALVQIPLKALITTKTAEQSDIGHIISQKALLSQEVLAAFLIWENRKGDKSEWAPYIHSLPKDFSVSLYLPQNLSLPELLKQPINEARQAAYRSFVRLRGLFPDLQEQEFKWAWSCVNTRAVFLPQQLSNSRSTTVHIMDNDCLALAPYLDLFNHSNNVSVDVKVTNSSYQLLTSTPYKKYDQVFINYGPHANIKLFVEYGFAIPDNPHDALPLGDADLFYATGVQASLDKSVDAKMAFLKEQGLLKSTAFIRKGVTWSALAAARLLCYKEHDPRGWSDFIYNERTETGLDRTAFKNFASIAQSQTASFENVLEGLRQYISEDSDRFTAVNACACLVAELRALAQSATVALMRQAQL